MQALETIHRQNATAAIRATGSAPAGTTHLIHCFTGLNLRETLYAKGSEEAAQLAAKNTDALVGNATTVEVL